MLVIRSKDINKQLEEGMMEYERVSRQVLEDGTYRDPYHVAVSYTHLWQGQSYHLKIINQISEADIIIKGVLKVSS